MSLLSHTGPTQVTSPVSFSQQKNEGIEMNSSLSVLTCCVLWLSGLKSGFFLLWVLPLGLQPSRAPPPIFQSEPIICSFLLSFYPFWGNLVLLSLWVIRHRQSSGDFLESCFLACGLLLAWALNKMCLLPVFTMVAPGVQEYNSKAAQFNQLKTMELTMVSCCISAYPTDTVTFLSK